MQQSQMTGLTTGTFDTLYVKVPPDQDLVNVANMVYKVEQLETEANILDGNVEQLLDDVTQLQTDVVTLADKQTLIETEVGTKQNTLTAQWPLHLNNDVLSFGFQVESDIAGLQAQIDAQAVTLAAHEATKQSTKFY